MRPLQLNLRLPALLLTALLLTGCGSAGATVSLLREWEAPETAVSDAGTQSGNVTRVGMVTDVYGVNDQGFNQSAWEGLQALTDQTGTETMYLDSSSADDFRPNFDRLVAEGCDLCWGIGFDCADAMLSAALDTPDTHFAIVDAAYEDTPANVTSVVFRAQEPSFLVGYVAAGATKTGKVGFVGGVKSETIDQFEFGYRAGVAYYNVNHGRSVTVTVDYIGNFYDNEVGRALALEQYAAGCDVVYQAAGGGGLGVIDAAVETDNYAIGVDRDQAYIAPEHILTSALKKVDVAVLRVSQDFLNGMDLSGSTLSFGMTEGAVGVPEEHENYAGEIYDQVLLAADDIMSGKLTPPYSEESYEAFVAALYQSE